MSTVLAMVARSHGSVTSCTVAPASRSRSAAASVLAATSASTLKQPRSTESAIRIPSMPSNVPGISSFGRSEATSLGCGPAITFSSSAQSATVRAIGPSWQ